MGWPVRWRRRGNRDRRRRSMSAPVQANPDPLRAGAASSWRRLRWATAAGAGHGQAHPAAVHVQLMRDPVYALSGIQLLAVGRPRRTEDAGSRPATALSSGREESEADMQIQLAGILLASNHLEQAATLYSQVLALDHGNTAAWQG